MTPPYTSQNYLYIRRLPTIKNGMNSQLELPVTLV
jgi:hypothetical protein